MSAPPPDTAAPRLTSLLQAAERGDAAAVAAALDEAPELLNQRGEPGPDSGLRTALHFGVHHVEVVRELLRRGADPNIRDQGDDAMPLHFAAEKGDIEVIGLLLEHGADPVGTGTMHELDVLGWATVFGKADPAVVELLKSQGARLTLPSAVALGDAIAVVELAGAGGDVNLQLDAANRRRRLLHLAVVKRQPAPLAVPHGRGHHGLSAPRLQRL